MRTIKLGRSQLDVSVVAAGCMRILGLETKDAAAYIEKCLELGINFFDHADIYGAGECEKRFAQALSQTAVSREQIILQSKCGIIPRVMYDQSEEYILKSVDGILSRMNTEYLDVLLLHRPDALVEPEEAASAFDKLEKSGKVRHFGVSNHKPAQIQLLKKYVKQDLLVDQLQFSVPFSNMIANGMEVNMLTEGAMDRDGGVLDYCRLEDITIQAWSPFQSGTAKGVFLDNPAYTELNTVLNELAGRYGVTGITIASAWILRHPANIQIIAGTMNTGRMEGIAKASDITLTRQEWYRIYLAAGHILP